MGIFGEEIRLLVTVTDLNAATDNSMLPLYYVQAWYLHLELISLPLYYSVWYCLQLDAFYEFNFTLTNANDVSTYLSAYVIFSLHWDCVSHMAILRVHAVAQTVCLLNKRVMMKERCQCKVAYVFQCQGKLEGIITVITWKRGGCVQSTKHWSGQDLLKSRLDIKKGWLTFVTTLASLVTQFISYC